MVDRVTQGVGKVDLARRGCCGSGHSSGFKTVVWWFVVWWFVEGFEITMVEDEVSMVDFRTRMKF